MKVAYLTGYDLSVHSIDWMLKDQYGHRNVTSINADDLALADLSQFDMLVLPGCAGEVSPYPDIMTPDAIANMMTSVEHGMILWTDCAATYDVMSEIEFLSSKNERKTRQGLGLYKGMGKGPIEGPAIAPSPEDRFVDTVIRQIFYNCANDCNHTADLCYGNGPGIYLSDEEMSNPDTRIIARYGHDDTFPAAAVTKKIGKGMILSLGVLVQIAPEHLRGNPTDENIARHRTAIFNHLSGADLQRKHFLDMLFRMVEDHHITRYTARLSAAQETRHANIA